MTAINLTIKFVLDGVEEVANAATTSTSAQTGEASIFFVLGCLVAMVAAICGLLAVKKRRTKISVASTSEKLKSATKSSDLYLSSNTKNSKKIIVILISVFFAALLAMSTFAVGSHKATAVAATNQSSAAKHLTIGNEIIAKVNPNTGEVKFSDLDLSNSDEWGIDINSSTVKQLTDFDACNWTFSLASSSAKIYDGVPGQTLTSSAKIQPQSADKIKLTSNISVSTAKSLIGKDVLSLNLNISSSKRYISHAGVHLTQTIAGQNSIESMKLAKRAGFDFMEVDVRLTLDNQLVAMHNPEINNTMYLKDPYEEIPETVNVADIKLAELKNNYVFKTDNPEYRTAAPTLQEFCDAAKQLGITLMIHPKTDFIPIEDETALHNYVNRIIDVCHATGNYIVSESRAVDYAVTVDPNIHTMRVVADTKDADTFSKYPNCILAVSYKNESYDSLVDYCMNTLGAHVESTLNTKVEENLAADVINYDYISPGKTELYKLVAKSFGDLEYTYTGSEIAYGTGLLTFKLQGKAKVTVCGDTTKGHIYNLNSDGITEYRIPHFIYSSTYPAKYKIEPENGASVTDINFEIYKH